MSWPAIENFLAQIQAHEQRSIRSVTIAITDARLIHQELTELLLRNTPKSIPNLTQSGSPVLELHGGGFRPATDSDSR